MKYAFTITVPAKKSIEVLDGKFMFYHDLGPDNQKNYIMSFLEKYCEDILQFEEHPGCQYKRLHCHGIINVDSISQIDDFEDKCFEYFKQPKMTNQNRVIHTKPISDLAGWCRYINKDQPLIKPKPKINIYNRSETDSSTSPTIKSMFTKK